jgi:TPP-dependent pyruvate/acetoin dehydrogenase alpha subunit
MSDPGTTYRTREEVQRMRSTQDPIRGLQRYLEEWGIATEQDLKKLDKEAKAEVDKAVEEAKAVSTLPFFYSFLRRGAAQPRVSFGAPFDGDHST